MSEAMGTEEEATRTLYLLRHAKSSWSQPKLDDHERPLNGRGRRAAALMAEHIASLPVQPTLILCSTALRTRETLAALLDVWRDDASRRPALVEFERGLYLAPPEALLMRLREAPEDCRALLLIGHNPGMHQLACALAGDRDHCGGALAAKLVRKFPTAALATFRVRGPWTELSRGTVRLVDYTTPGELAPSEGGDDD
jgi:phosphohistidine phosphatase